jgi:hypothetical protein
MRAQVALAAAADRIDAAVAASGAMGQAGMELSVSDREIRLHWKGEPAAAVQAEVARVRESGVRVTVSDARYSRAELEELAGSLRTADHDERMISIGVPQDGSSLDVAPMRRVRCVPHPGWPVVVDPSSLAPVTSIGTRFDGEGRVAESADVPVGIVARLRPVCLGLPEAYEEPAWVGTRWRIRTRTFAHVLTVTEGWPPAYARAAASEGPVTLMTFRSSGPDLHALGNAGHPFFRPPWGPNVVGMVLDSGTDWNEVAELLTDSYCLLAPTKLAMSVDRPDG